MNQLTAAQKNLENDIKYRASLRKAVRFERRFCPSPMRPDCMQAQAIRHLRRLHTISITVTRLEMKDAARNENSVTFH